MRKWVGLIGILLVLAGALLIRFPSEQDESVVYTGLLTSESVKEYPVYAKVVPMDSGEIGVALQDYELDFGVLSQGMRARKTMNLNSEQPVKVSMWAEGNISSMVEFSRSGFVLEGNEPVEVSINASDTGSYSGTIYISSRSLNQEWMGWFVSWI